MEERKKNFEERRKRNEEKRKQQLEQLEKDVRDGQFGVQIFYPDYLENRTKKKREYDPYALEHEVMEMCVTCGCGIF